LGTFVHEQARALRTRGLDIRIVQPLPLTLFPITLFKESYRKLAKIPEHETYDGFELYHPRYVTLPRHALFEYVGFSMYYGIRRLIANIYAEWPFDIIHAHTTYPCGFAANLLRKSKFPSVRVIHTIHRTCIIDAPNYNRRCFDRVRIALEGADQDVFVSLEGQRLAHEYTAGRIAAKSEYITNGVNGEMFDLTDADWAEVSSLKATHGDSWNLVFVGYLKEVKGVKELLLAIRKLVASGVRKLHLFLVGRNELGTYVDTFVREAGLAEFVTVVGPVAHDRIKIWMHFADAFILPSHSEGLPTVLFEALYAGAPAIFTRVGGVGDIVEDGRQALLIPPKSVESIEQAVLRLMNNPELCKELGSRGHKLIRDNYTWAKNAGRCMDLFERVVASD
jgi:glycosyltransferase involved in cell wall biosynthesis